MMEKSPNKPLNMTVKFHLLIVLPLLLGSIIIAFFSYKGLSENASYLTSVLRFQGEANKILPLLLTQDDASKAILINPDSLDIFSEKKLKAYDDHKKILHMLHERTDDKDTKDTIGKILSWDEKVLRPLDTKILEELFEDIENARSTYFSDYEPARQEYEKLIRLLGILGAEQVQKAQSDMKQKNEHSIFYIVAVLVLGVIATSITIILLSRQIERSEANMKSLLAGLTEGVFFFDKDGIIAPERSQALEKLLPESRDLSSIHDFMKQYSGIEGGKVDTVLSLLWPKEQEDFFSDFLSTISMFPKSTAIGKGQDTRHLTFEYRELTNKNNELTKVVVIVADITETLKSEMAAQTQAERARKISKAAANLEAFQSFRNESNDIFNRIDREFKNLPQGINLLQAKRDLHTLKGSLAICEFTSVSEKIHEFESYLESMEDHPDHQIKWHWAQIKNQWDAELADLENSLGFDERFAKLTISKEKYLDLSQATKNSGDAKIEKLVDGLLHNPIDIVFGKYENYIQRLSDKSADKKVKLKFSQDSSEISFAEAKDLDGSLVHLLRNSFDHGIETIASRLEKGKDESGTIEIKVSRKDEDSSLQLILKDDGGGIDGEKLAAKALSKNIWSLEKLKNSSEQDKIELIFEAGLSTREEVTDISGRGTGMDAVKAAIESLGGRISVNSHLEKGTKFSIIIPKDSRLEDHTTSSNFAI